MRFRIVCIATLENSCTKQWHGSPELDRYTDISSSGKKCLPNVIRADYRYHLLALNSFFKPSKWWQALLGESDCPNPALNTAGIRDQFKSCHVCNPTLRS